MNFSEKKVCIEWFNEAINSRFGAVAESFLLTFKFPRDEKHTMYSFAKSIEKDSFNSIEDMVIHFKKEVEFITTTLGCNTNAGLYIRGYFKELIEKLEFDFMKQEPKKFDFSFNEQIQTFEQFGNDLPNDMNSFLKMKSESSYPTDLQLNPPRDSSNESASMESVNKLDNKIKEIPNDRNLKHIAEIIQFYQNTSNDGDQNAESFKYDLSKLSGHTLSKINEYIEKILKSNTDQNQNSQKNPK